MAYKISISGIKDPTKIQDLIKTLSEYTGLQPKTVAESLKNMPLVLPLIQDEMKAKGLFIRLEAAGAAIELSQTKDSLLDRVEPQAPKVHHEFTPPEKVPRPLYNFKKNQKEPDPRTRKIILGVGLALSIFLTIPFFIDQANTSPVGKKGLPEAQANPHQKNKAKAAPQKPANPSIAETSDAHQEATKAYPEENSEDIKPKEIAPLVPKIEIVKPINENTNLDSSKLNLPPSSASGQGIPKDIDPNTVEGKFHLAKLRENTAKNLKAQAKTLSPREKIALLKKSLNLDPYDDDSWQELKTELKAQNKHQELQQVQKKEQQAYKSAQETLEEISRSVGGVSTNVKQSLSEIQFKFSKSYTKPADFQADAREVFDKFRVKYPERRIVIEDRTGLLKIHVAAGDSFPN